VASGEHEAGLAALHREPVAERGRVIGLRIRRVGAHLGVQGVQVTGVPGGLPALEPDVAEVGLRHRP
jgi:hypothetical protein